MRRSESEERDMRRLRAGGGWGDVREKERAARRWVVWCAQGKTEDARGGAAYNKRGGVGGGTWWGGAAPPPPAANGCSHPPAATRAAAARRKEDALRFQSGSWSPSCRVLSLFTDISHVPKF